MVRILTFTKVASLGSNELKLNLFGAKHFVNSFDVKFEIELEASKCQEMSVSLEPYCHGFFFFKT